MDRAADVCQVALVERHRGTGEVVNELVQALATRAIVPSRPRSLMTATR